MVDTTIKLPDLTTRFIVGTFFRIIISSVILYISVKLVGGSADIKKSIYLTTLMELMSIIIPLFTNGILFLAIYVIIWLFLVVAFFKVSVWKALLIALVQYVVAFILIGAVIGSIVLLIF